MAHRSYLQSALETFNLSIRVLNLAGRRVDSFTAAEIRRFRRMTSLSFWSHPDRIDSSTEFHAHNSNSPGVCQLHASDLQLDHISLIYGSNFRAMWLFNLIEGRILLVPWGSSDYFPNGAKYTAPIWSSQSKVSNSVFLTVSVQLTKRQVRQDEGYRFYLTNENCN